MNVSKTLAAAIAATTIVGAVGLAYAQTTTPAAAPAPVAAPADAKTTVITPGETQKSAAPDPSLQPPAEGSQGTQSGAAPAADKSVTPTPTPTVTATPPPVASDKAMSSEPLPKADRN